ncbi:MAG TPA: FeoA family protein [Steroidobacteraceae bacterium]
MDACVDWSEAGGSLEAGKLHSLASLHKGARGTVSAVRWRGAAGLSVGDTAGSTITRRLLELGFAPGEPFEIIEEIRPGGDPIAVRIGSSVFALRRREAEAVVVRLE